MSGVQGGWKAPSYSTALHQASLVDGFFEIAGCRWAQEFAHEAGRGLKFALCWAVTCANF
jgi:hypothetical protein